MQSFTKNTSRKKIAPIIPRPPRGGKRERAAPERERPNIMYPFYAGKSTRMLVPLPTLLSKDTFAPVSYTHLDVYKRQPTTPAARP